MLKVSKPHSIFSLGLQLLTLNFPLFLRTQPAAIGSFSQVPGISLTILDFEPEREF